MATSLSTLLKGKNVDVLKARLEPAAITAADVADLLATEAELVLKIKDRIFEFTGEYPIDTAPEDLES